MAFLGGGDCMLFSASDYKHFTGKCLVVLSGGEGLSVRGQYC